MPQNMTIWARNARFNLLFLLGGCCSHCSSTRELETPLKTMKQTEYEPGEWI